MSDPGAIPIGMRIPGPNDLTNHVQIELLRRSISMENPGAEVIVSLRVTREEALQMLDGYLRHTNAA